MRSGFVSLSRSLAAIARRRPVRRLYLAGALVLSASAVGVALAGPCYTVGNWGPARKTCEYSVLVNPTNCPVEFSLGDPVVCGSYTSDYHVPLGTSGNEPGGLMDQREGSFPCKTVTVCERMVRRELKVGLETVVQFACVPGMPIPTGATSAFGPSGSICTSGGGYGNN